jgi:hypothetical protein
MPVANMYRVAALDEAKGKKDLTVGTEKGIVFNCYMIVTL